jgi:MFS family permease
VVSVQGAARRRKPAALIILSPPGGAACAQATGAEGVAVSHVSDRLITPHFLLMCGFSFTVFLSAFQLLPTAPFRIVDLGGTPFAAGLFLGFLTYASAFSAPLTGALADRVGRRRTLIVASLVIAAIAVAYSLTSSYRVMLVIVLVHGVFWSSLLSASAAYMTDLIPAHRRAEGIGYWGMATTLAVAVAPSVGLWVYRHGWGWLCVSIGILNLAMTAVAALLRPDRPARPEAHDLKPFFGPDLFEWRVVIVAFTFFLLAFGHGGVTSFAAMYADAQGIAPRGVYFIVFAATIILTRPFSGRLADRLGYVQVFLPCILLTVFGYSLLAAGGGRPWLVSSAFVHGLGFGSAYPIFAAHVMRHVGAERRGAAFGGILAALDTGIGTGSIAIGWIIQHRGYGPAFLTAAIVATLAAPYFLVVERRVLGKRAAHSPLV